LPKAAEREEQPAKVLEKAELPTGTETILLVEGNRTLLKIASTVLTRLGYSIVTASDGIDALEAASGKMAGRIDLLLTDLVMPEMSGKELSDRIHSLHPRVKTLFSSDCKQTGMVPQEVLDKAGRLLQKPYTPSALADYVRAALDSGVNGNHGEKG
jgi:DNA-binding NtrC family response regulator